MKNYAKNCTEQDVIDAIKGGHVRYSNLRQSWVNRLTNKGVGYHVSNLERDGRIAIDDATKTISVVVQS